MNSHPSIVLIQPADSTFAKFITTSNFISPRSKTIEHTSVYIYIYVPGIFINILWALDLEEKNMLHLVIYATTINTLEPALKTYDFSVRESDEVFPVWCAVRQSMIM